MHAQELQESLGRIDIYLLDQILRGHVPTGSRVLDAGCGGGRNLVYFLRAGHPVAGTDHDPEAIAAAQRLATEVAPKADISDLRVEPVEALSFDDATFDLVICNAVLHFARDHEHWDAMLDELWRVLTPGGMLFTRLASSIGIEAAITPIEPSLSGHFMLPDGSGRYLVDERRLLDATMRLGGALVDPIKTTNVQGLRCMTTWVVGK